jgi:hypothetical protein
MRIALLLAVLSLTPGCARLGLDGIAPSGELAAFASPVEVDGFQFRSFVRFVQGDERRFVVTTRRADRALPQALEAGRIDAVRYCLGRYGGSRIIWATGPDGPDGQVALTPRGDLRMSGRCVSR